MATTKKGQKKESRDGTRRAWGPRALAESVAGVTKPIYSKRGLADGAIARDWPHIVGAKLASHSAPEKIAYPPGKGAGGTLVLRVEGGSFATELQHLMPLLIERINSYFGYRAVDKVRLVQGPLPPAPAPASPPPPPRPLEREEEASLEDALKGVADPDLKAALEALGRSLLGQE